MTASGAVLLWFQHDLRLADNPALELALRRRGHVIPLFIWSPEEEGSWPPGAASRWWLHHSLARLQTSLRKLGSRLIIRSGRVADVLGALVRECGATAVCWNRRYEPAILARDRQLQIKLGQLRVQAEISCGSLLFEPEVITTQSGAPYQVFSAFWRRCMEGGPLAIRPRAAPVDMASPQHWPASMQLAELNLLSAIDWAVGLRACWEPGEEGANVQLRRFLSVIDNYDGARDFPGQSGTSKLSPHLHFGEISLSQIWSALDAYDGTELAGAVSRSMTRFRTELGWREFAHHLLFHFPETPEKPLRAQFASFPWKKDQTALRAWQRGETGFPIVDAGMRELWSTGWMHNRVRMIVASFLAKDLMMNWLEGARWFWDTLVDADLANNTMGWQWTAGCGADAAPYFRIFNPSTQSARFDPQGDYVRHWIPELAKLPTPWIHDPAAAPAGELKLAGVSLDQTYPKPIVNHAEARRLALAALETTRAGGDN
jgi:deoxyribodipyrimidine photo-lyase